MHSLWKRLVGHALVVALSCLVPLLSVQAQTPAVVCDKATRNGAIVRAAFEDWANGGSVFRILAPDITWTIAGSGPVAGTYHGIDDFTERASRPLVSRLAAPLRPTVHSIWAVDDTVVIRFNASSETTAGHPYNNQFVWIFRMQDGLVVEAEAFLDLVAYQAVIDRNPPRQ
jgi:hypothetical protein